MTGEDFYSFANLWRQYRACRRDKRGTLNALAFEVDAEANLLELQAELRSHTYEPGRSICFVTGGPKPREVFAADFRDRVVHHLLVSRQEPLFERRFISDSYACRTGKGTLAASDALQRMLRALTANGRRGSWALRLDVSSFFSSIDKGILYRIIARAIRDPEMLWLTRVILFHDPTRNYRFRSLGAREPPPGSPDYPVPERKSLFGKLGFRGLPIGNLTSQFWANVYLDVLDQFVKRTLRCRYYVRYVDDLVLLSRDRDELAGWRVAIERCLRERLALELRPGVEELVPVARGVDFVGWKTWRNRRLVRRRTSGNLTRAVDRFERSELHPAFDATAVRIDLPASVQGSGAARARREGRWPVASAEALRATLASYAGHLRWHAWSRTWHRYPWLDALFARDGWTLLRRWPGRIDEAAGYAAAYRALTARAGGDCLVFWRVGRFVEFHGPQRVLAQRVLGLATAHIARGDYALTAGFPARLAPTFAVRALRQGKAVALPAPGRSWRENGAALDLTLFVPSPQRGQQKPATVRCRPG